MISLEEGLFLDVPRELQQLIQARVNDVSALLKKPISEEEINYLVDRQKSFWVVSCVGDAEGNCSSEWCYSREYNEVISDGLVVLACGIAASRRRIVYNRRQLIENLIRDGMFVSPEASKKQDRGWVAGFLDAGSFFELMERRLASFDLPNAIAIAQQTTRDYLQYITSSVGINEISLMTYLTCSLSANVGSVVRQINERLISEDITSRCKCLQRELLDRIAAMN